MHAFQNAGGHVLLSARPYPIESDTAIMAGSVVKLVGGLVVQAAAKETGAILGIAAETHTGVEDMLDLRSNGEEILVYDNPELIFESGAPELTAASGTETTLVFSDVADGVAAAAMVAGVVQLKSRVEGGGNEDVPGQCRKISAYAEKTATVSEGGAAAAGDVYYVYPAIGSIVGAMDEEANRLVLTASGQTKIRVVGHDPIRHKLRLMAVEHSLGVEN